MLDGVITLEEEAAVEGIVCSDGNLGSLGLLVNATLGSLIRLSGLGRKDSEVFVVGSAEHQCNMHLGNDGYDLERHFPEYSHSLGLHE